MPSFREKVAGGWKEIRGNLAVELAKWIGGSTVVGAIFKAISQAAHRVPVDWMLFTCLLMVGLLLVVFSIYRRGEQQQEESRPVSSTSPPTRSIPWDGFESGEAWGRAVEAEQKRTIKPTDPCAGLFAPLQFEALKLSSDLLEFLNRLGPEPQPKYTAKELSDMPSAKSKALIMAQDGDYAEACEYHSRDGAWFFPRTWQSHEGSVNEMMARWKRLYPWYQKVASSYALEFKGKLEILRHRLVVQGLDDDGTFSLPVEGRDGVKNIRTIAAKLWELAYKAKEKEISGENS